MARIAIAAILFALASGPASAQSACPSEPETASSGYVSNGVQRSLCLQRELAGKTQRRQDEARFQSQINNAIQQMEMRQRMQAGF